jgi:cyclophilin family peptidyl-prolyl cis-trans isomerase
VTKGTFTECPKCGTRVTKEKLRRHLNNVHGDGGKKASAPASTPGPTVKFPWKAMGALAIVGILVFATGYMVLGRVPPEGGGPTPGTLPIAVMETSLGTMQIELDTTRAPRTAGNFINLVRSGFYDGLIFHRVVPNFVIQGGDPNGDGTGGSGTTVDWEDTGLQNVAHTIAMARTNPNDATSQFFINLIDNPNLDTPPEGFAYVVFGRVVGGHEVVGTIGGVPTGSNDRPLSPVTITRAYMQP